jgi:hypothetical protein
LFEDQVIIVMGIQFTAIDKGIWLQKEILGGYD